MMTPSSWHRGNSSGFTLTELVFSLWIVGIGILISVPGVIKLSSAMTVMSARNQLVLHMRYTQAMAQGSTVFTQVRFAPYAPEYWLYHGGQILGYALFPTGVTYKGNYLGLASPQVTYDVFGNSQVGGTIRLVDGTTDEADINLYMGAGLVTEGGEGT